MAGYIENSYYLHFEIFLVEGLCLALLQAERKIGRAGFDGLWLFIDRPQGSPFISFSTLDNFCINMHINAVLVPPF